MHELSLCQRMLEIISDRADKEGFTKIKNITLKIGVLTCVDKLAFNFAFEVISKNTITEGAQLIFNEALGEAKCLDCKKTSMINDFFNACQYCGSHHLQLLSGDEFVIEQLEIE